VLKYVGQIVSSPIDRDKLRYHLTCRIQTCRGARDGDKLTFIHRRKRHRNVETIIIGVWCRVVCIVQIIMIGV